MVKLQKPPYVFMNGQITDWEDAKIHIGSEALIRGISVFEGIKGYWKHDNSEFSLLALHQHFNRLRRSALLQHLPFSMKYEEFHDACAMLIKKLLIKERDLWLRPTLFSVEGHWGEGTISDLVITGYHQDKKTPEPIKVGISSWQRSLDNVLPTRIKSAANYQMARIARIEGRRQGFDDMILLNQWGRVGEATGSCVLMVRDGCVATPPPYEGCLESITVNIIETLCGTLEIPFERRPVDRTELLIADEVALAGTLMEIGIVSRFEGRKMPKSSPCFDEIKKKFWELVRKKVEHLDVQLSLITQI